MSFDHVIICCVCGTIERHMDGPNFPKGTFVKKGTDYYCNENLPRGKYWGHFTMEDAQKATEEAVERWSRKKRKPDEQPPHLTQVDLHARYRNGKYLEKAELAKEII